MPRSQTAAARAPRAKIARSVGLAMRADGVVLIPDALVEIERPDGSRESRAVEVGSSAYNSRQIREKVAAGFRFYQPGGGGSARAPALRGRPAPAFSFGR